MAANDVQVLIVVDIYPGVAEAALEKLLPPERRRLDVLRLTEFGAPKLERPPHTNPVDWYGIGEAVEKIAIRVHEIQDAARPHSMQLYIGGRAPLATFVHLGSMFTKSVQKVVVFNTPHEGSDLWEPFTMDGAPTSMPTQDIFDKITGFPNEPSPTTGRVGLVVDSGRRAKGESEPTEVFEKFLDVHHEPVGSIAQLRSYDEKLTITEIKMPAIVRQFAQRMSTLPHRFPKRKGLALFTGVPAQVAFALGRSINANVLVGDVWLTEYRREKNEYEKVYALPFVRRVEMKILRTTAAILARQKVLQNIMDALTELQAHVELRQVPTGILNENEREKFVRRLEKIRISRDEIEGQPFELRVLEGRCRIGEGILEALVSSTPQQQKDFAKLLLLHEIVHDWQVLRNTNHPNIGQAGFVLEHIDYLADVFAVRVLVNVDLHRGGLDVRQNIRVRVLHWLDMLLRGITAFDQAEQGNVQMERLAERRLRRYLLWHVQKARAMTLETPKQFERMMESTLTVEMAPLTGWLDAKRWEKMVRDSLPVTELCIAIDGKLIREGQRAGFEPQILFDAIRTYMHEQAHAQVYAVVNQHRDHLMPWTSED
jgi:hypothetical protein